MHSTAHAGRRRRAWQFDGAQCVCQVFRCTPRECRGKVCVSMQSGSVVTECVAVAVSVSTPDSDPIARPLSPAFAVASAIAACLLASTFESGCYSRTTTPHAHLHGLHTDTCTPALHSTWTQQRGGRSCRRWCGRLAALHRVPSDADRVKVGGMHLLCSRRH